MILTSLRHALATTDPRRRHRRTSRRSVLRLAELPVAPGDTVFDSWRGCYVFERLSRVRSGNVADARVGRYVACRLPPGCSSAPAPRGRGRRWPARSSRSRRPRATAQRRSRARLAGAPGNRRAMSRRRECRHRVPHAGNLADRRQVAEGCRLAPSSVSSPAATLTVLSLQPARSWLTAIRCRIAGAKQHFFDAIRSRLLALRPPLRARLTTVAPRGESDSLAVLRACSPASPNRPEST